MDVLRKKRLEGQVEYITPTVRSNIRPVSGKLTFRQFTGASIYKPSYSCTCVIHHRKRFGRVIHRGCILNDRGKPTIDF